MVSVAISAEKLQEILQRLRDAQAGRQVDLTPYLTTLIAAFESLLMLFDLLAAGGQIVQVRKLFGVKLPVKGKEGEEKTTADGARDAKQEPSTTTTKSGDQQANQAGVSSEVAASDRVKKTNPNHNGKAKVKDYPDAAVCEHTHDQLKPGELCPSCGQGKLYLGRPRQRLLFQGQPPISPVRHIFRDLYCGLCKAVFPVKPSAPAAQDGLGKEDRYGYSAIALIVIMKYFSMLPFYRGARLNEMLGTHLAPSTQFDQAEKLANVLAPLQKLMMYEAAQAKLLMADDASARILSKTMDIKPKRTKNGVEIRDGCHSSVAVAFDQADHMTVHIKTDVIHAGEWIDAILGQRCKELARPMIMWDRVSYNTATVCDYIDIACNQHARQNFKDLEQQFPQVIRPILDGFKRIFFNDAQTITMRPAERLHYHQTHSLAVFDRIIETCHKTLTAKSVTDNSDLGRAFQYMINHESALRGFLEHEGAPLSNNLVERIILYIVLLRRASHFFRTPESAAIADTILGVGLSAFLNGVNLYHYFRLVMLHQKEIKQQPELWLPWRFLERFPEYQLKQKSRAGSWPINPDMPYIPLQPPR